MRQLWLWHASEELEHRCTAFDLYRALNGNELWRKRWMRLVSLHFAIDVLRQTAHHLWRDGQLFNVSTWRGAQHWLFGRQGLLRWGASHWRAYFRADFHPSQFDDGLALQWLGQHQDQWRTISKP
jgi:predicted metal-dependent hydrolase